MSVICTFCLLNKPERINIMSLSFLIDLNDCKKCPHGTWSLKGWDHCDPRKDNFLQWTDPHSIIISTATGLGILVLLGVFIVFMVFRNSPPMRRAEVRLSCVMMVGLVMSFGSVICFVGRPNEHLCQFRQVMYGIGFTMCVSCIIVKAYRIFLAFIPFGQMTKRRLYRLYKPPLIVIVLTALQGIVFLFWMIFDSPDIDDSPPSAQSMINIIKCREGHTYIGFGIMLSYIALLAFVGFVLAFKVRKVPQEFSETGYIIFSMVMYLFVWGCFIPIYVTNQEQGTVIQASAMLVSSYGIIFCHFLPKCHEALWGSNTDPVDQILRRFRVVSRHNSQMAINADIVIPRIDSHPENIVSPSSMSTILTISGSESVFSPSIADTTYVSPFYNKLGTIVTKRSRKRSTSF